MLWQTSLVSLRLFLPPTLKKKIVPPADPTNVYNTADEKLISSGVFYLLAILQFFPTKQKGSSARKSPFTACARTRHPPPQRSR
jgi:hypothetical protein